MKALKFLGTIVGKFLRIVAWILLGVSAIVGWCHLVEAGFDKFAEWRDYRKSKKEAEDELFNE